MDTFNHNAALYSDHSSNNTAELKFLNADDAKLPTLRNCSEKYLDNREICQGAKVFNGDYLNLPKICPIDKQAYSGCRDKQTIRNSEKVDSAKKDKMDSEPELNLECLDLKSIQESYNSLAVSNENMERSKEESGTNNLTENNKLELLRRDGETYALRRKKLEIQELLTDAEIFNQKLKMEQAELVENLEKNKAKLFETLQETKWSIKNSYEQDDVNVDLRNRMKELEEEVEELKKELIEKIILANTAKRFLANTEVALEHISNAYENKRQESKKLTNQVDQAEKIICDLKGRWKNFTSILSATIVEKK